MRRIRLLPAVDPQLAAGAARDQMRVVVEHRLSGGGAVQLQRHHAVRRQRLAHRPRHAARQQVHLRQGLLVGLEQVLVVPLRDHQRVSVGRREQVEERQRVLGLDDLRRRRTAGHDVAEDACGLGAHQDSSLDSRWPAAAPDASASPNATPS